MNGDSKLSVNTMPDTNQRLSIARWTIRAVILVSCRRAILVGEEPRKMSIVTSNPRSTAELPPTMTVAGEERHVIRGATWRFYDWLTERSVIGRTFESPTTEGTSRS